uniref:hypothetical protein n=1 Tax=Gormaniella terricola TaxID=2904618 RepID=UPI0021CC8B6C|nr:hypothetical protein ODF01_pgp061 [Gormaniella terricola]UWV18242.1 hypothetical protein [Gormaniella terricola]
MKRRRRAGIYMYIHRETKKVYIGSSRDLDSCQTELLQKLKDNTHENLALQQDWNNSRVGSFYFQVLHEGREFADAKTATEKKTSLINEFITQKREHLCFNLLSDEKKELLKRKKEIKQAKAMAIARRGTFVQFPLCINGVAYDTADAAEIAFGVPKRMLYDKLHQSARKYGPMADLLIIDLVPIMSPEQANQISKTRKASAPYNPKLVYQGVSYLSVAEAVRNCGISRTKFTKMLKDSSNTQCYYLNENGFPIRKINEATTFKKEGKKSKKFKRVNEKKIRIVYQEEGEPGYEGEETTETRLYRTYNAAAQAHGIRASMIKYLATCKKDGWLLVHPWEWEDFKEKLRDEWGDDYFQEFNEFSESLRFDKDGEPLEYGKPLPGGYLYPESDYCEEDENEEDDE